MNYTQDILKLIDELELLRVAELKKFGSISLIVAFVAIIFFIKFRSNFLPVLVLGFFILVGSYYFLNSSYKIKVKNSLMPKLIALVDEDFVYAKDSKVDFELINSFKLFSHKVEGKSSEGRVSIQKDGKSAKISSIILNSIKVDTEEGEHESKRFDGVFVILELKERFDQKYLLSPKVAKVEFEAGDTINPPYMGLKPTAISFEGLTLYSEDGKSSLDKSLVENIVSIDKNIKAIFERDKIYLFIDGVGSRYDISLFKSLKEQNFFDRYVKFLKDIKEFITSTL